MNDEEQHPGSAPDRTVEEGGTYEHADHGRVEVTGIWYRTRRLEAVRADDERGMIVVRFVPGDGGTWIDELAEPLDDFLEAIE